MDIVLTRIEADAVIPPSGCTNNIVLQISDGTAAGTKTLVLAADENDSGPLSMSYSAGSTLRLSVVPPSGCVTSASSINVVIQYHACYDSSAGRALLKTRPFKGRFYFRGSNQRLRGHVKNSSKQISGGCLR
jgi:hypothetical protein